MTKIAVPSDDRKTIANHFGRTAGFLVFHYADDRLQSEYRPVAAGPQAACCGSDGESRHHRIVDVICDCDVVIAGGMGGGMMMALRDAGIEVALSTAQDARKAVEMFVADILPQSTGSGCCTG